MSLSCIAAHAPLLHSLADPCAAACMRVLAHAVARDVNEITSADVQVMRAAAAAEALLTCFQAIIAHCHASHQPLLRLRLAHPLQTIINRAAAHGLYAWLSSIPLPLLHSAGPPTSTVPPLPLWFAAAVTVMDDSTLKQVLTAAAAAAAAFAAALVARSDASLTPPCAAAAAQWCALLPMLITPSHAQAAASAPLLPQVCRSALPLAGCRTGCMGERRPG